MNFSTVLLQTEGGGFGGLEQLIPILGILVIFYFFMIRPQQKKAKDAKNFQSEISKGDTVVTVGGIHGKVVETNGATIVLDIDRGTRMTFERTSISIENTKRAQGK